MLVVIPLNPKVSVKPKAINNDLICIKNSPFYDLSSTHLQYSKFLPLFSVRKEVSSQHHNFNEVFIITSGAN